MEIKLDRAIEAVLFLKGRAGSDLKELSQVLKVSKKEIESSIIKIEERFKNDDSVYEIRRSNQKIRISIKNELAKELSTVIDRTINIKLSKSVIETLTIIAYNQPTTKPEIEKIRGVSSDYAIRKLLDFELIEDAGKSDLPGQPRLFKTTVEFLDLFNMKSILDLPKMDSTFEEQTSEIVSLFDRE